MIIKGIGLPDTYAGVTNRNEPNESDFSAILEKAVASKEEKQLKDAAVQFEALFIYQMFSKMRDTVARGGLIEESMGEKVFQGMFDQEVSIKAAETGGLGLANMIYEQMRRK